MSWEKLKQVVQKEAAIQEDSVVLVSTDHGAGRASVQPFRGQAYQKAAGAEAMRIDVVKNVKPASGAQALTSVSKTKIIYTPRKHGLLIGEDLYVLPDEVEAYGMIVKGKLNREALLHALPQRGRSEDWHTYKELVSEEWLQVHVFETDAWFCSEDGVRPLFRGRRSHEKLTEAVLEDAVRAAATHYFQHAVSSQGQFVYAFNPVTNEVSTAYNMLRHAGTVYAMLQTYAHTNEADLLRHAEKAVRFLVRHVEPVTVNGRSVKALVHKDEIKLGGHGLALLALSQYIDVTGDKQFLPVMQGLAEWMLATQDETKKFAIHKMSFKSGKASPFTSDYYPGEAILGLVRLYHHDGDERWLDAAEDEAHYLINDRDRDADKKSIPHDHWLLYALNDLYPLRPKQIYVDHAYFIGEAIMDAQRLEKTEDPDWHGSYDMKGTPRSTPTACRSEGLSSLAALAERVGDTDLQRRCIEAAKAGILFQLRMQYRRESVMFYDYKPLCIGAVHTSLDSYEIRNDFTQHSVSSFLGLLKQMHNEMQ
ncbi:hypothetical protein [Alkalicoccus luteus]|uniref:hypothetical protein n=1 Tax=Alkalicoccus luteus TaxID=1237094 RepID=UPI004034A430